MTRHEKLAMKGSVGVMVLVTIAGCGLCFPGCTEQTPREIDPEVEEALKDVEWGNHTFEELSWFAPSLYEVQCRVYEYFITNDDWPKKFTDIAPTGRLPYYQGGDPRRELMGYLRSDEVSFVMTSSTQDQCTLALRMRDMKRELVFEASEARHNVRRPGRVTAD